MGHTETQHFDHVIIGAGAGGLAAAKLLSLEPGTHILFEQHAEPGGCAGYFARGNPTRLFDAGATQLVCMEKGELQRILFDLGQAEQEPPAFCSIPAIECHFPQDGAHLKLTSEGRIEILSGKWDSQEVKSLERIFQFCYFASKPLWNSLKKIPKFPIKSFGELRQNLKIFFQFPIYAWFLIPFSFFISAKWVFLILGLRARHEKSKKILNSLLLDTSQNTMEHLPAFFAFMGLSILQKGLYRGQKGMRSYFKKCASQIVKNNLPICYLHQLNKITFTPQGFLCEIIDKKNKVTKKILAKKSLFLNTTLWNIGAFENTTQSQPKALRRYFKKLRKRSKQSTSWGACALFGSFEHNDSFPKGAWTHQIFPDPTYNHLKHALYVSIYPLEEGQTLRHFTATIHQKWEAYQETDRDAYHDEMTKCMENTLKIKIENSEFASPKTYEKYTGRKGGRVGGLILRGLKTLLFPVPSSLQLGQKKLFLVGDSVFPGQGVVSASLSGVIAWERATGKSFLDHV
jgi:phytoene dehydrogenase-like protein